MKPGRVGTRCNGRVTTARVSCDVIAPALIPRKPGERVKTNRRDARKLAELGRAGLLTAVQPPTPEDEAVRDLARARDDAREDLQRCRHRLGKLLLRRGLHFAGRNWTRAHRQWIESLTWTHAAERAVVDDYLLAIDHTEARLVELDSQLAQIAEREPYREPVGWLRCFRGIDTLTAMLILAELHDFRRFASAPALMAYLGLVPGEDSTGEKHRRGPITRTGNALVRRLLVETAWHYQHRPGVGVALTRRRKGQPVARHRDRGQGAAAPVSTLSEVGGGTQTGTQDRRRDRARTGGLSVGRVATGTGDRELTAPRAGGAPITRSVTDREDGG